MSVPPCVSESNNVVAASRMLVRDISMKYSIVSVVGAAAASCRTLVDGSVSIAGAAGSATVDNKTPASGAISRPGTVTVAER